MVVPAPVATQFVPYTSHSTGEARKAIESPPFIGFVLDLRASLGDDQKALPPIIA